MVKILDTPRGRHLLLALLLLKDRHIELDTYGLDYSLKLLTNDGDPEAGQRSVLLLHALLADRSAQGADCTTQLGSAFSTPAGRTFMLVHESGGTEWFNKERYEELAEWFAIISLMKCAAASPTPRTIATCLGRLATENSRLNALASHAGYRSTLLMLLLKPVKKEPVTGNILSPTTMPARKTTDVQGTTRTKKAKTPDNKIPR